jgi:hypothetical protein
MADDLVLIAETREQLQGKMATWRDFLGLKISAGKTKVRVSQVRDGSMTSSGVWPCGVCGNGGVMVVFMLPASRSPVRDVGVIVHSVRKREAGPEVCGDMYELTG